jgi:hypothetical protein
LSIKREKFINLLKEFPDDYEKFIMIKDKILLENELDFLDVKCYACESKKHLINECNYVHFVPNYTKII